MSARRPEEHPGVPRIGKGWNRQQHELRVERGVICLCSQPCTCTPDPDVVRLTAAGMSQEDAVELAKARQHWLELEEMGDPHVPGEQNYLLLPPGHPKGVDAIADMTWRAGERASRHPAAELLDPLWLRRFRRVRGPR